jgi:competence protein ComEA
MVDRRAIGIGVFVALIAGVVSLKALSGAGSGIPVSPPQALPAGAAATGDLSGRQRRVTASAPRNATDSASPRSDPSAGASALPASADVGAPGAGGPNGSAAIEPAPSAAGSSASPAADVVVQVAGAVKHPGVYRLQAGARNDDAVKAAGGLGSSANAASVNLAARAIDGSQLYVRSVKEQPDGGAADPGLVPPASATVPRSGAAHGVRAAASSGHAVAGGRGAKLKDPSEGRININTASAEELQRIPHVGPAMAEKVIAFREANHGFQSAEDL